MRRVVYLIEQPLDERNYQRFGIQTWLDRKWSVEVWDLTPWAHPRTWESFRALGLELARFEGYYPIDSARSLRRRLACSGGVQYLIDLTGESYCSIRAKWGLQRRGAARVTCASGSIPIPPRPGSDRILPRLASVLAKGPAGAFIWLNEAFFTRYIAPRVAPDLTVLSGESSLRQARHSRSTLRGHNFDYDIYLRLARSTPRPRARYGVFIDQDYCFHPEFVQQGNRTVATAERYFPTIRGALAAVASALDISFRVAAHPRASYRQRGGDYFGDFPITYGNTAELVSNCEVAVCHDSTAIQFAVLFNKPVIFLTTDELCSAYEGRSIEQVAAELGKEPINLDRTDLAAVDWAEEMRIDAKKYEGYKRKYIKMNDSPDIPLWDILINHIEGSDDGLASVTGGGQNATP